jgi:opacity protein-like surface antigen
MLGAAHQNSGKVARTAAYTAVVLLLLSPIVVPAVAAKIYAPAEKSSTTGWANRFTPAGIDSRLADRMTNLAVRQTAFPFTPAGLNNRGTNILTVAARADSGNAVSVRNAIAQIGLGSGTTLRLNNSNYQLTAVRGWQAFEMPKTLVEQPRLSDLVGKGSFRLDDNDKKKPSRFNSDVSVAPAKALAPSPRGNAAAGNYDVNVGGSFRLTKGIDVTAGIRYSRDNDRVDPSTQIKADNEAVYVGTKIRF